MELYRKHRPKKLDDIIGQREAVTTLQRFLDHDDVPHALLFAGPAGCGKTSLARLLRPKLGCHKADFQEMDVASSEGGIDTIRALKSRINLSSLAGKSKIYYLDEAHQLSSKAGDGMLKMLEDTPAHVYFMLATTDPDKLKKTIRTRCTTVQVKPLGNKDMRTLLDNVLEKEGVEVPDDVLDRIVEVAGGSAREALVILNKVYRLDDEEKQLEAVFASSTQHQAIELARALLSPRARWGDISKLLKEITDEPESLRRMVLGYCSGVLTGNGKLGSRAYFIIRCFQDHWYDCGKAGLVACCYECCHQAK